MQHVHQLRYIIGELQILHHVAQQGLPPGGCGQQRTLRRHTLSS